MSDALSSEWQKNIHYIVGDRVAFKLGNAPGVAAFECTQPPRTPTSPSLAETNFGNTIHEVFPGSVPTTSPTDATIFLIFQLGRDMLYNIHHTTFDINLNKASEPVYHS
ncbi:hypothetical protein AX15_006544 [Amanita polypyramis BW_CC]|nr:hypothetical protein AX15_006544 [Amanita polypyramis BW_CC]